jgi:hypothetical protein
MNASENPVVRNLHIEYDLYAVVSIYVSIDHRDI